MDVSVHQLVKRFGTTIALKNVSLAVRDHEFFFLLGPSGCGKTTLLRTIAGFYQPDEGELRFGSALMNGVPAHQRNTGMVFQNYALWPHMSVAENIAYGLKVRKVSPAERDERVNEALRIVRMEAFKTRTPNQLSGGQQQRVALGRALVVRPDVLLLDEPLSNLDAKLRLEMRAELRRIHAEAQITTIYVTHDQKEALSLADRMAILRDGVIEQIGDPRTIYREPANRFVADFIGETNWLQGIVRDLNGDTMQVETAAGNLTALKKTGLVSGQKVSVGFRPEAVQIGDGENRLQGTISDVNYLGEIEEYELQLAPDVRVKAFEQNPAFIRKRGATLAFNVRPQDVLVLSSI